MTEIAFVLRGAVGVLLLLAATGKFHDLAAFRRTLRDYRVLPAPVVGAIALLVPITEAILGVLFVSGVLLLPAATAATILLLTFTLAQLVTIAAEIVCRATASGVTRLSAFHSPQWHAGSY